MLTRAKLAKTRDAPFEKSRPARAGGLGAMDAQSARKFGAAAAIDCHVLEASRLFQPQPRHGRMRRIARASREAVQALAQGIGTYLERVTDVVEAERHIAA